MFKRNEYKGNDAVRRKNEPMTLLGEFLSEKLTEVAETDNTESEWLGGGLLFLVFGWFHSAIIVF